MHHHKREWKCKVGVVHVIQSRSELIQWYKQSGYQETGVRSAFPKGFHYQAKVPVEELSMVTLEKPFRHTPEPVL